MCLSLSEVFQEHLNLLVGMLSFTQTRREWGGGTTADFSNAVITFIMALIIGLNRETAVSQSFHATDSPLCEITCETFQPRRVERGKSIAGLSVRGLNTPGN